MVSYNVLYGGQAVVHSQNLPDGHSFLTSVTYGQQESTGVLVLVIVSCVSSLAVLGLLTAIVTSAVKNRSVTVSEHVFVRTHVAAYFVCLLLCDLVQAAGSIMSLKWVLEKGVQYNGFCSAQGFIKQLADVGTAIWSFIIATHTFGVLFLQFEPSRLALYISFLGGWTASIALVLSSPAVLNTSRRGPFWGISGYWCWITEGYAVPRITCDYLIMFLSAFFCFFLYVLIFLRLRGKLDVEGLRVRWLTNPHDDSSDRLRILQGTFSKRVAGRMLWYPLAYTIMLLPIAVCRSVNWAGHEVPFAVTVFADSIFLLSGLVNVILFVVTHLRHVPGETRHLISRPSLQTTTLGFGGDTESLHSDSKTIAPSSDHSTYYEKTAKALSFQMDEVMLIGRSSPIDYANEHGLLPNPWAPRREGVPSVPPLDPVSPLTIRPPTNANNPALSSMPTAQFVGASPFMDVEDMQRDRQQSHRRRGSRGSFGSGEWSVTHDDSSPTRSELIGGWDKAGLARTDSINSHIQALYRTNTSESRRPDVQAIQRGDWDIPPGPSGRF